MTIDERLHALTMNLELLTHDVETLRDTAKQLVTAVTADGEHIRALARIAELHDRRLTNLEGDRAQ